MILVGRLQPGWKLWFIAMCTAVLGAVVGVGASVNIADRNTKQQIQRLEVARLEQARLARLAVQEQLRITCNTIRALNDAYAETPPTTTSGKNVRSAYIEQYRILGCPSN